VRAIDDEAEASQLEVVSPNFEQGSVCAFHVIVISLA
jgi:hypothetical protein